MPQFAVLAVEEVGGNDLVVVVRRVREGAAAVAVAERPDPGYVGGQGFVDDDVAVRVGFHTRLVQAQVVGVRSSSDGQQDMQSNRFGRSLQAVHPDRDTLIVRGEADARGRRANADPFALQDLTDRDRDILVLARR